MPPAPTPPAPTPTTAGSEFRLSWIDHPALPAHGLGLCRCPGSRDGARVPPSLASSALPDGPTSASACEPVALLA